MGTGGLVGGQCVSDRAGRLSVKFYSFIEALFQGGLLILAPANDALRIVTVRGTLV